MQPGAERRAIIALFAVFALMVQALVPAIANAAPVRDGQQVVCTEHGLQTVSLGDAGPAKNQLPAHCEHCVCPPVAAQPPAMVEPAVFVAYAREARPQASSANLPPPARAPPRPPGQGPPTSDA
jgi:hypothetical protein